jgi:hypothetical protein
MRRSLVALAVCPVLLMSGCPQGGGGSNTTVSLPASDTTSPIAKLDVFNLPSQPTASPGNPESVDSGCCAKSFTVPIGRSLDLVAAGEDFDGGVKSIAIWVEVTSFCTDSKDLLQGRGPALDRVDIQEDTSSPSPGASVRTRRIAQGPLRVVDHAPKCLPEAPVRSSYSAEIWAEATNFAGLRAVTKHVTLKS